MRTNWRGACKQRAIARRSDEARFCEIIHFNTEKQRPRDTAGNIVEICSIHYKGTDYNILTETVIRLAIEVHKELGPGLLESVYETCLVKLLKDEGIPVKTQVRVPFVFRNETLDFAIQCLCINNLSNLAS
ncbi:MAG: GxxExxY protein [Bacteroidia bacterium]|nr:GxxExxY protein [Bacteroidia bacterium]